MKRKHRGSTLYQGTRVSYRVFEEHWDPKTHDLEPLTVTREVPSIQILLAKEPFEGGVFLEGKGTLGKFLNSSHSRPNTKGSRSQKAPLKRNSGQNWSNNNRGPRHSIEEGREESGKAAEELGLSGGLNRKARRSRYKALAESKSQVQEQDGKPEPAEQPHPRGSVG